MGKPKNSVESANLILVTGGGSGIGNACVEHFAERGWNVLAAVRQQLDGRNESDNVTLFEMDVTNDADIEKLSQCLEERLATSNEQLRGIVHAAGIAIPGPLELTSVATFRKQLEVNTVAPFAITKELLPMMSQGTVFFVGSTSGQTALPGIGSYCVSKFALRALADAWREELIRFDQQVVLLELDQVMTPIWSKALDAQTALLANQPEDRAARYTNAHRLQAKQLDQMLSPIRVAEAIWSAMDTDPPPPLIRLP